VSGEALERLGVFDLSSAEGLTRGDRVQIAYPDWEGWDFGWGGRTGTVDSIRVDYSLSLRSHPLPPMVFVLVHLDFCDTMRSWERAMSGVRDDGSRYVPVVFARSEVVLVGLARMHQELEPKPENKESP
jgi:hypothetical protein